MIVADLQPALVGRIAAHLGFDLGVDDVIDPHASFFADGGFRLGSFEFDSMDFVEMIVALEGEFAVSILDADDIEDIDALSKLGEHILARADRATLDAFVERWS